MYSVGEVVDDDLKFLGYHFLELVRRHVGSEVVVLCEFVDLLFEFVGSWVGHGCVGGCVVNRLRMIVSWMLWFLGLLRF